MARTIKGEPKNFAEAVYLFDRNRITVQGARTRAAALEELRKEYGDGEDASHGSDDSEGSEDGDSGDLPEDYAKWNMDQLKDELGARDLSTSGNKADLVARLEEDDEENSEEF